MTAVCSSLLEMNSLVMLVMFLVQNSNRILIG